MEHQKINLKLLCNTTKLNDFQQSVLENQIICVYKLAFVNLQPLMYQYNPMGERQRLFTSGYTHTSCSFSLAISARLEHLSAPMLYTDRLRLRYFPLPHPETQITSTWSLVETWLRGFRNSSQNSAPETWRIQHSNESTLMT